MIFVPRRPAPAVLRDRRLVEGDAELWRRSQVRDSLKEMFSDKCCYCEQLVRDPGEVEHYRPKSRYAWLKNVWRNMLWACRSCNGYKGNKFPPHDGKRATRRSVRRERSLVLNACETRRPDRHLVFDREGDVRACGGSPRGRETIEVVKLDRSRLRRDRRSHAKDLLFWISSFLDRKSPARLVAEASRRIKRALAPSAEFSALSQQLLWEVDRSVAGASGTARGGRRAGGSGRPP